MGVSPPATTGATPSITNVDVHQQSDKAARYLNQLEDARCEGRWDQLPELVRKVRKHAKDKNCLATAAEAEQTIIAASHKQAPASRPGTAVSAKDLDVSSLLPKLLTAIEKETSYAQDRYQAQVCVGWLHWTVGEYDVAEVRLPSTLDQELPQFETVGELSEWTKVCALKSAYLKANCLSRTQDRTAALSVFESALGSLSPVFTGQKGRKQLRFWAELFLTEYCMLQSQAIESGEASLEHANSLASFRSWAGYWESASPQGIPIPGGHAFRGAVPRRRVWYEYYAVISEILEQDIPFPTGYVDTISNDDSARNRLRVELKKIEASFEALLLTETAFPRADEEREEVENFARMVMRNWTVLSGPDWHDYDLGPGGKEGLSRGVLDILYRAATKTFHSTAILRYLFTVHLSVADFELAFKAFDSYLDIVKKGKVRVDKTGCAEPGLDDDGTVVETVCQAITALCRYGFRDAAEKARDLGTELEEMLQKLPPPLPNNEGAIPTLEEEGSGNALHPRISSRVHAFAWQAIGLAQAQWSRMTYEAASRSEIQSKAIRSFQKSLSPESGNPTDVRTLFTLGLLLAEQRELTAAIDIVKAALLSNKKPGEQHLSAGSYWRERSLIPLWHLLALLLSARQEFILAAQACEGAFAQFDDPTVLFGSADLYSPFRSDHLNQIEAQNELPPRGLVDEMDDLEKESIMEIKMTHLALLELLEGPEPAVNASHELLLLYNRLYGARPSKAAPAGQPAADVPKSSAGTVRSLKDSIFGSKTPRTARSPKRASIFERSKPPTAMSERPSTRQTVVSNATATPTLQLPKENGSGGEGPPRRSGSSRSRRSESMRLQKRDHSGHRSSHQRRTVSSGGVSNRPTVVDGEVFFTPMADGAANERPDFFGWNMKNNISSQQSISKGRGLLRLDSSVSSVKGSAAGSDFLVVGSLSPPNPLPPIQFSEEQQKIQRQAILIRVWLMIADFYCRAELYKDSRDAISEAQKIVDEMEDTLKDTSGDVVSRNPEWGSKKSLEELWSDVRAEMGNLAAAEGAPYVARAYYEAALLHFPNHPPAMVGLSNILLDIYSEILLPPPAIPSLNLPADDVTGPVGTSSDAQKNLSTSPERRRDSFPRLPSTPLGLNAGEKSTESASKARPDASKAANELPAPYKAVSLPLLDRLAARDRAYGLLSNLTKLGTGWNRSDAWFALARAHEQSGQPERAKEALWWCVELEEGTGVRSWSCVGAGGYVL